MKQNGYTWICLNLPEWLDVCEGVNVCPCVRVLLQISVPFTPHTRCRFHPLPTVASQCIPWRWRRYHIPLRLVTSLDVSRLGDSLGVARRSRRCLQQVAEPHRAAGASGAGGRGCSKWWQVAVGGRTMRWTEPPHHIAMGWTNPPHHNIISNTNQCFYLSWSIIRQCLHIYIIHNNCR